WRALVGDYLYQVQPGLSRLLQGLRGGDDAELFPAGADQADRADADLLIHARPAVGGRGAGEIGDVLAAWKNGRRSGQVSPCNSCSPFIVSAGSAPSYAHLTIPESSCGVEGSSS